MYENDADSRSDVAALLEHVRRAGGATLKEVVNKGLRRGLKLMTRSGRERAACHTEAVSLGRCLIRDLGDVTEALAVAEGEAFR
jgi:hypothetical protein